MGAIAAPVAWREWVASGEKPESHFGFSVGTAGDVNGDGYADVVIGADRYAGWTGRAYVYTGSASGLSAAPFFTATGQDNNNHFGFSVGTAGDVNGDGYDDIIVGAYHYVDFTGRAYVYAGGASGMTVIFTATGENRGDYLGRSVGTAGDINGDGYTDVIVGAPHYGNYAGRAYVYAGGPGGLNPMPVFTVTGEDVGNTFGSSVGTAGDVNGDGYADVIVGAPGYKDTGRAYVFAGGPRGLSAAPSLTITGESVNDSLGFSVATAGDVNGDGYDDVIMGAFGYDGNTGRIYVFAGGPRGLRATPIFTATGQGRESYFGRSVATAGDVNRDGYADIIIGASGYARNTGRIYIYAGSSSGLSATPIFTATGEGIENCFGKSAGMAGDVNKDGYADVIVGAYCHDNAAGRAYVYPGVPRPIAPAGDQVMALVHGTLIDGTGAPPLPDAAVVIQQGRIVSAGASAQVKLPDGVRVIDVQGATILPGLINAHVHQGYSEQNLKAWAQGGVTTVRDLGASPSDDLFARRDALLRDPLNARLVAAGPMVTVPDGYPMVPWGGKGLTVASPQDAASKVDQLLDSGADVIKIAMESGGSFRKNIPMLSAQEAQAIVQAAHHRGGWVSAHVLRTADLERALDAGADDIAHMVEDPLTDALIQRMVKEGVYWVPTLELWQRVGLTDKRTVANLSRFVKAGGKVALGTDYAGYAAEFDLGLPVTEIELMHEAGMTPMQIVVAATQHAARVCNLSHELGTLEPSKIADVLVVDGDPLQDLQALSRVRLVVHRGVIIRPRP